MNHLIAICIGHSRLINGHQEGGAISIGGVSEWTFNAALGAQVCQRLDAMGLPNVLVNRYQGAGYTSAQTWLGQHLKAIGATVAIELHFNASDNPQANGHEWLHWHASKVSARLANCLQSAASPLLGKPRGLKPVTYGERGAEFLRLTPCPAVICEPGFGSNAEDWNRLATKDDSYAQALARACANFAAGH